MKKIGNAIAMPTEDDYQAEDDVRILIKANQIRADKKRLAKAIEFSKKRCEELEELNPGEKEPDADTDD